MSLLPNITYANPTIPLWASNGSGGGGGGPQLSSFRQLYTSSIVASTLVLDSNTLTTANGEILFNGTPLASISSTTSSITNWSAYSAVSDVQMSGFNVNGANVVNAQTANVPVVNTSSIVASSITTNNLIALSTIQTVNYLSTQIVRTNIVSAQTVYADAVNATTYNGYTVGDFLSTSALPSTIEVSSLILDLGKTSTAVFKGDATTANTVPPFLNITTPYSINLKMGTQSNDLDFTRQGLLGVYGGVYVADPANPTFGTSFIVDPNTNDMTMTTGNDFYIVPTNNGEVVVQTLNGSANQKGIKLLNVDVSPSSNYSQSLWVNGGPVIKTDGGFDVGNHLLAGSNVQVSSINGYTVSDFLSTSQSQYDPNPVFSTIVVKEVISTQALEVSSINGSNINNILSTQVDLATWASYPPLVPVGANDLTLYGSNSFTTSNHTWSNITDAGLTGDFPTIDIKSKGGAGGAINITADTGAGGSSYGRISLTANGGSAGPVGLGGLVEINANTPGGFSNLTSAVKINAAGVNSYAGAIPSIASAAGYNFIYGTAGINLCATLPSLGFQIPGTIYMYAPGGVANGGIRFESPAGVECINNTDFYFYRQYPYYNPAMVGTPPNGLISGRVAGGLYNQAIDLEKVNHLYFGFDNARTGQIDFLSTINGATIDNFDDFYWSRFGAIQSVEMNGSNSINNCSNVNAINVNANTISTGSLTTSTIEILGRPGSTITLATAQTAGGQGQPAGRLLIQGQDVDLGQNDLWCQQIRVGANNIVNAPTEIILIDSANGQRGFNTALNDRTIRVVSSINATTGGYVLDSTINPPLFSSINNQVHLVSYFPSTTNGSIGYSTITAMNPVQQYGRGTLAGGVQTIVLSRPYADSNEYSVNATYRNTAGGSPLHINILSVSSFTVNGSTTNDFFWTTIGRV